MRTTRMLLHYLLAPFLILLICVTSSAAQSYDFPRPLAVANGSPVVAVFGIPKAHGTDMLGRGNTDFDLSVDLASDFNISRTANESIILDGETARVALAARYGINDSWNVGVELPWVRHGGGSLDGFIVNWHDFWGFPQHGRDTAPRDRIDFRYTRDGSTLIKVDSTTEGPGDIVLSAQRRLMSRDGAAAVFDTQLKLPTGDPYKLTGSGAVDAGAGLELSRRWRKRWFSSFHAGVAYLGDGDVLPALQRNWAAYGGLDVVWRPLRALALRVQFDGHTSPYQHSSLHELSDWSGMLAAGGTWYITRRTALDLAVIENVPNPDAVSDVIFQFRLRTTLGGRS